MMMYCYVVFDTSSTLCPFSFNVTLEEMYLNYILSLIQSWLTFDLMVKAANNAAQLFIIRFSESHFCFFCFATCYFSFHLNIQM